jgi:hypothetical protein
VGSPIDNPHQVVSYALNGLEVPPLSKGERCFHRWSGLGKKVRAEPSVILQPHGPDSQNFQENRAGIQEADYKHKLTGKELLDPHLLDPCQS